MPVEEVVVHLKIEATAPPGVTVRAIPQIDGETGFAEIFFDNVEVPEAQVLGEVGGVVEPAVVSSVGVVPVVR